MAILLAVLAAGISFAPSGGHQSGSRAGQVKGATNDQTISTKRLVAYSRSDQSSKLSSRYGGTSSQDGVSKTSGSYTGGGVGNTGGTAHEPTLWITIPGVTIPGVSTPRIDTPALRAGTINMPSITVPVVTTPVVNTPVVSLSLQLGL